MVSGGGPVFVARATDGLGPRLRNLMMAMVLADVHGGTFSFTWPSMNPQVRDLHAVTHAGEFFAEEFVQKHLIAEEGFDPSQLVPLPEAIEALASVGVAPGTKISVTTSFSKSEFARRFPGVSFDQQIAKAFASIQLTEKMETARAAAANAQLPTTEAAAIHLRAGDIVYGIHREMDSFHAKVVSYPLAIEMISRMKASGVTPVLFGQDPQLLAYLRDNHGAFCAADLGDREGYDDVQNALFDICLLGRCSRIIAGTSGFAVLGAWLAQVTLERPDRMFDAEEAVRMIEHHVLDAPPSSDLISPHQKAFAARAAFVLAGETIATREPFWRLLEAACTLDPVNPFLLFVQACSLYEDGKSEEAESSLAGIIAEPSDLRKRFLVLLRNKKPGRTLPYLDALAEKARSGHVMASFCCAVSYAALGRKDAGDMLELLTAVADEKTLRLAKQLVLTNTA